MDWQPVSWCTGDGRYAIDKRIDSNDHDLFFDEEPGSWSDWLGTYPTLKLAQDAASDHCIKRTAPNIIIESPAAVWSQGLQQPRPV